MVLLLSVSLHIEGAAPPLLEAAYCSQRRDQLFGVAQVLIRSTVAELEAVEATGFDVVVESYVNRVVEFQGHLDKILLRGRSQFTFTN